MPKPINFQSSSFQSSGLRIAGNLYLPDTLADKANQKLPAIIIGHQASAVKEQAPALYAEHLVKKGFAILTFDTGTQGESEGEVRGVENPFRRVEEFKDAVSFLTTRPEIDAERIGLLGICASGGYVVPAAVTDHRVKAVATLSGVDVGRIYREGADGKQDPAVFQAMLDMAAAARTAEAQGKGVGYMPIFTTEEAAKAAGVFMADGWDYYRNRVYHPNAATEFTLSSIDMIGSFEAFGLAYLIAPRPLLVIIGTTAVTANNSLQAYENAKEPKAVFWIEGASHGDLYDKEPYVSQAVGKLGEFFQQNL